ncbi:hypothetical protein KCN56_08945 [Photobacterium galatheae]|uniref:XAC2610-related protein n=1 Tax=Photobacterium galatheae TaxID=1654360 RepID=UPI00202CC40A|nr:hypothetical protein [Photobacterium galatheae]MCM0148684.1 hypothetical protein [Photobacterium galatheae]
MKYRIAVFLSVMFFSVAIEVKEIEAKESEVKDKFTTASLVEEVNIYHEYMDIVFVDDDVQTIQTPHDVEYLEYRYRFVDINFDGYQDLVIDDNLGANQMSEIFLYHPAEQLFSESADWEINGLVVNAKRKLICGFYNISASQQEIHVLEKSAWAEHVVFDHERNHGESQLTGKTISQEAFQAIKNRCMH